MKKNKLFKLYKSFAFSSVGGVLFIMAQACTDKFEEINTNPYAISDKQLEIDYNNVGAPFVQAQQNLYSFTPAWVTQLQQNLIGDVYSGYMMAPNPFASNSNNMTYNLVAGWNGFPWNTAYQNVMAPLAKSDKAGGEEFIEFKAWSKILRVEAMHRVSDIYGPIIYSQFGVTPSLYDCQEDVYNMFFADLEFAINTLTPIRADEAKPFTAFDNVYDGSYENWIRFANSLRLRLAIRISNVNPSKAKAQAEAAMAHPVGLLVDNSQNFMVKSSSGATHPLNVINASWNDIRMGAPMESILKGYSDPRIKSYFETATDNEDGSLGIKGEYKGIRAGIEIKDKSDYQFFSALTTFGDVQLMTASEVYFLRAEAALKGWSETGGSAQELYEKGIQTSFDQHGLGSADNYIADNVSVPDAYNDPFNPANDIAAASTVTIAYNAATGLEQIITQKWIAMYPDGQEAWSEFRRTGYPKLFLNMVNLSGGKIPDGTFIKRINFPADEIATNPQGVASGEACLGAADNGGSSLWWDVD